MLLQTPSMLVVIRVIVLALVYPVLCIRKQCFNLEKELEYCARKHRVQMPANPLAGYSFGYGSLNDTEYMCRSKWHILVFQCMRTRSEEMCRKTEEEKFRQLIWSISLETRKFEKAAAYMCHEHNLRILNEHKSKCLARQEKRAELCNVHGNDTIREVVAALQNQSSQLSSNSNEYYDLMRKTLSHYECKSLLAKLECLYAVLHNTCPPDAVRLIMNYFKETLPDGCTFSYESRLQRYIDLQSVHKQQQQQIAKPDERSTLQQDMGKRSSRADDQTPISPLGTENISNRSVTKPQHGVADKISLTCTALIVVIAIQLGLV